MARQIGAQVGCGAVLKGLWGRLSRDLADAPDVARGLPLEPLSFEARIYAAIDIYEMD